MNSGWRAGCHTASDALPARDGPSAQITSPETKLLASLPGEPWSSVADWRADIVARQV